jgi:carboxymethylenebutenolidase
MDARITRRGLVVGGAVVAGYALAVQPVHGEAIRTPDEGLEAGEVRIPAADIQMRAYRARPKDKKPVATVLVVHEIFGVHEYIQDVCRRLAKEGYLAIAPDLYQRQGDVTKITDLQQIVRDVVAKVGDEQVMKDLDATVAWAKSSGEGDTAKLGITGFCWGGRTVWMYSAHSKDLKAGVAWYGRLVANPLGGPKTNPLDVAANLNAPVLGLYGGKDQGIPLESVEKMREALKKDGDPSQIQVYDDAAHGFHADYRPSYNDADAKDGWKRLLEWFRKNGVA